MIEPVTTSQSGGDVSEPMLQRTVGVQPMMQPMPQSTPQPVPQATPRTVMLLEDDHDAAAMLIDALGERAPGARVERVLTLHDFFAYDRHDEIDTYLIDLGLPDGDGVSAFEFLRKRKSSALALVVSSQSDHASVVRALAAGARGYLCKYDARCDVERALQIAFDGGATVTPTIAARLIAYARADEGAGPTRAQVRPGASQPDAEGLPDSGRRAEFKLTTREHEVLTLASKGYTFPQVAELMGTRISTVYTHVRHIYEKMSVSSISQALFEARHCGLL